MVKRKMIVYFAKSTGEFNYMLPILKKTGGILVAETKYLRDFVMLKYPFVNCYLDVKKNLLNYHPDVVVLAGNHGTVPKKVKCIQIFHGLVDKGSIYQKARFKDSYSLLYKMGCLIDRHFPRWFRKFTLQSEELWDPFKKLGLDKLIKNRYDLLCLFGKQMEDRFRNLNLLDNTNWKRIGFPRLDCVMNNELSRKEIFKDLDLNPKLKTILYAPTWGGHQKVNLSSIPDMGLEICKSIDDSMNFIFKPHPCVKEYNEFPKTIEKIGQCIEDHSTFVYPDASTDIIPLMYISDLFITDFSTVAAEYLAFDRPIIFADHLGEKYNNSNLVEIWMRDVGEIVQNPTEFKKIIKECLDNPSEKSEIRKKFCNYFFYAFDGKASERAAKNIVELANR